MYNITDKEMHYRFKSRVDGKKVFEEKKSTILQYIKTLSKNKLSDVTAFRGPLDYDQLLVYATCGPSHECIWVGGEGRQGVHPGLEHELEINEQRDVGHVFIEVLQSRGRSMTDSPKGKGLAGLVRTLGLSVLKTRLPTSLSGRARARFVELLRRRWERPYGPLYDAGEQDSHDMVWLNT
ncbi:hypothetical protein HPB50_007098 [Hyalomma asiaticum]|uniref:Uncharacterized protein n=1 Tax=Hyalomma asiaticum TaxID=266040 RepID=A0ACB7RLH7_HYAAI|nr:hypothetical protein HPB50_007098 [Hyalomma asiaticum]